MRRLYRALAIPSVYRLFGRLVAPEHGRRAFANEFVRARPGVRVLDIGCGPGDVFPYLGDVEYTGFDANPEYIETAKANYGTRARFHCARVSEESLRAVGESDIVLAQGVVHHLDDEEARHLHELAWSALKPGGRLVTIDPVYVEGQSKIARFVISRDRGEHVRDHTAYIALAAQRFPSVRPTVRTDFLRIPYTHLVLECDKPR